MNKEKKITNIAIVGVGQVGIYLYNELRLIRVELEKIGVSLTDIKPGYVNSNMTKNLSLPSFLVANPKDVAKNIISGIENKTDVLYTPFFWKYILYILKRIPSFIFKRLNL